VKTSELAAGSRPGMHNPAYDFNDEAIPAGTSYWGTSRRNRTRGLTLLPLLRRFDAVFDEKLRRDDLRFEVHAGKRVAAGIAGDEAASVSFVYNIWH
jgi:hypothetical protein